MIEKGLKCHKTAENVLFSLIVLWRIINESWAVEVLSTKFVFGFQIISPFLSMSSVLFHFFKLKMIPKHDTDQNRSNLNNRLRLEAN